MQYALEYGADAVYAGMPAVSLRARVNNFDADAIGKAVGYAHEKKKKAYVTLNIYAHNRHLGEVEKHLKFLKKIQPDGIIVSDPGIIMLAKKHAPNLDIHLSTQANATNWRAVEFWRDQGVKRVILGREVTLEEIKEIKRKLGNSIELEYFIHGAMCMAYSGRCILSKWMTGRSANLGDCAQPCRWKYHHNGTVYQLDMKDDLKKVSMRVEEDRHGTYFFNSYDLNLIEHTEKLIDAGVDCLKIEGRAKSMYYVAIVCRAYRKVLDAIGGNVSPAALKKVISEQKKELENLAHRGYTEGFLFGRDPEHNFEGREKKFEKYQFAGEVEGEKNGLSIVRVHNALLLADMLEALDKNGNYKVRLKKIYDHRMNETDEAHGGHERRYFLEMDRKLERRMLLRKKISI